MFIFLLLSVNIYLFFDVKKVKKLQPYDV